MFSKILALFVACIFVAALAPAPSSTIRSLVMIQYNHNVCTGFVVSASEGRVLTVAHCAPDDPNVELLVDGKPSKIIRVNEALALLSMEPFSKPPLQIASDSPKVGDDVQAFGYGYGYLMVLKRAVAGYVDENNHRDVILDGAIAQGMSGGPVVGVDGKVVGINQASDKFGATSIVCDSKEIRKFLK